MFGQLTQEEVVALLAKRAQMNWVFFRVAKAPVPVSFAEDLVRSMEAQPFRLTIAQSDDLFSNLNYGQDDMSCTIWFACNPRSSEAVSVLREFAKWARQQGLGLDVTPVFENQPQEIRECMAELVRSGKGAEERKPAEEDADLRAEVKRIIAEAKDDDRQPPTGSAQGGDGRSRARSAGRYAMLVGAPAVVIAISVLVVWIAGGFGQKRLRREYDSAVDTARHDAASGSWDSALDAWNRAQDIGVRLKRRPESMDAVEAGIATAKQQKRLSTLYLWASQEARSLLARGDTERATDALKEATRIAQDCIAPPQGHGSLLAAFAEAEKRRLAAFAEAEKRRKERAENDRKEKAHEYMMNYKSRIRKALYAANSEWTALQFSEAIDILFKARMETDLSGSFAPPKDLLGIQDIHTAKTMWLQVDALAKRCLENVLVRVPEEAREGSEDASWLLGTKWGLGLVPGSVAAAEAHAATPRFILECIGDPKYVRRGTAFYSGGTTVTGYEATVCVKMTMAKSGKLLFEKVSRAVSDPPSVLITYEGKTDRPDCRKRAFVEALQGAVLSEWKLIVPELDLSAVSSVMEAIGKE